MAVELWHFECSQNWNFLENAAYGPFSQIQSHIFWDILLNI